MNERIEDTLDAIAHVFVCIDTHFADSRERAIVKTKLDEAVLWLSRAALA